MDVGFGEALLFSGALLALAAALSGLMHGTVLSISVLSVSAGLILAEVGAIHVNGSDTAVVHLFLLALIVTLFSDGLFVERELLVVHWGPVVRALLIAWPCWRSRPRCSSPSSAGPRRSCSGPCSAPPTRS
jgi:NhaP-type Na+/H+ or K+/H+ antiporter